MDKTGTYKMVNKYTESLKKSSMTQKVNKLHKMCLVPFLKDLLSLEGRLRKFVTDKDRIFWEKFLSCCYAGLKFEERGSTMGVNIYIGYSDDFPSEDTIVNTATVYSTDNINNLISDRILGKYFWIAVPTGYAVDRVENLSVAGDYISSSYFKVENITLSNGNYVLYSTKTVVPLKSVYKIILK